VSEDLALRGVHRDDMSSDWHARSMLPIPDRPFSGLVTYDAKDSAAVVPPIEPLRPPGAPNVLVVLLDDVGFAASSAFGGPVNCPTAERLADNGLRYNRFHTTGAVFADETGAADRP
jgi:Sulfatase